MPYGLDKWLFPSMECLYPLIRLQVHPKGETGDIYTDRHTPANPISVSSTGI